MNLRHLVYFVVFLVLFTDVPFYQLIGWNVLNTSANVFFRLTPTFYISLLTCILILYENRWVKRYKQEIYCLLICILISILMVFRGRMPVVVNLCNCFIWPIAVSVCVKYLTQKNDYRNLHNLIVLFLIIECGVAIIERIIQYNFLPYLSVHSSNSYFFEEEIELFRSTSLHGHALTNALLIDIILSFILVSKQFSTKIKLRLFILGYIAILCFNSRSSIIIMAVALGVFLLHNISHKKLSDNSILLYVLYSLLGVILVTYLMFNYSFGGRMFTSELMDESAEARIQAWELFQFVSLEDLFWGADLDNITRLSRIYSQGHIENWLIIFIFNYGIILFSLLVMGMYVIFKSHLKSLSKFNVSFVLLVFFIVASTNNSLAVGVAAIPFFFISARALSQKSMINKRLNDRTQKMTYDINLDKILNKHLR